MAGSKVVHCSLHDYHHEARDFDSALIEFKSKYCHRALTGHRAERLEI